MALFAELAEPEDSLNNILKKYNVPFDESMSDAEIIYDLCIHTKAYKVLRQCAVKPFTVKELTNLMIKQVERFKDTNDWKKQDGQFIQYPTTWLNAKMWEDEFETDTEKEERIDREIMEGIYGA